ncbi:FtsX-like permease family protein [Agrilactobacillus fermenti]|uniref:FtsX-like permease family protein n=1 Tax=Agrilactobacillus fermenti TaxID=2586909 RepID=UPI003A5C6E74
MLGKLGIKSVRQNPMIHSIFIVITALSTMASSDFLLMAADPTLTDRFKPYFYYPDSVFRAFSTISVLLLIAFSIYWNRLFMRHKLHTLGLLELLGLRRLKILILINGEILISQLIATSIGILTGLLFYKLLAMILLKICGLSTQIGFYFDWQSLLITIVWTVLIQLLLAFFNGIKIRRWDTVKLTQGLAQKNDLKLPLILRLFVGTIDLFLLGIVAWISSNIYQHQGFVAEILGRKVDLMLLDLGLLVFWIISLWLLFAVTLPTLIDLVSLRPRLYFKGLQPFWLAELKHWFINNHNAMFGISIFLGISFSLLTTGSLFSRYIYAATDDEANFSIISTAEKRPAIQKFLQKNNLTYDETPPLPTKLITASYQLDSVVNGASVSGAGPTMLLSTHTFHQIQRANQRFGRRGYSKLNLAPGQVRLIIPQTGLLKHSQFQQTQHRPNVKLGSHPSFKREVSQVSRQFPLNNSLAFQSAIILTNRDYQAIKTHNAETYYGFHLHQALTNEQLLELRQLNQKQRYRTDERTGQIYETKSTTAQTFYRTQIYSRQETSMSNRILVGVYIFVGVFVSLVFVVAMAQIIMLKRLIVAETLRTDFMTLEKIGVPTADLRRGVYVTHTVIFGLLYGFAIVEASFVTNFIKTFVNNPNQLLMYGILALVTLIYSVIYLITNYLFVRMVSN